jgi:folate-binding protein YgfZ
MMSGSVEALTTGKALADLSSWRKIEVSGADGTSWLDALVTADLEDMRPGRARRSLLLSPTGGVRADFTVVNPNGGLLLIQDPSQPRSIFDLLSPYILSSDVQLSDRSEDLALFAFPGLAMAPDVPGATPSVPSCLGQGADLIAPVEGHERFLSDMADTFALAARDDVEAWRVRAGIPRFGQDVTDEDLPQEGGLEAAVSFGKGCFLGQEAVAKVRNLGHPRRVLLLVEADAPLRQGDQIFSEEASIGTVTSASGNIAIAKVRWQAREGPFRTSGGSELRVRT